ncbi:MAG: LysM peptidoglycan-binding domain-containing protein [Mesorhizobium sp.]|nr:MAG: LysM peptidoglycan-binding domain-containing protein [Mesorhizobium sp.]
MEKNGYQWVEVQNGDSIRLIAKTHSADVAETVVLNMDHILSPDVIFSGDRIYLPATFVG